MRWEVQRNKRRLKPHCLASKSLKRREKVKNQRSQRLFPLSLTCPPLPFSQRFAKVKLHSQFGKFLDMLKMLHVNAPFLDDLSQMPLYAKFLKEILSKKRKIKEHETVILGEKCSVVVLNQLPAKLNDCSSSSMRNSPFRRCKGYILRM